VNDGKDVNEEIFKSQNVCFFIPILCMLLIKAQKKRKCFIKYYKTYEIIALKKHVNVKHALIFKKFEEDVNG